MAHQKESPIQNPKRVNDKKLEFLLCFVCLFVDYDFYENAGKNIPNE